MSLRLTDLCLRVLSNLPIPALLILGIWECLYPHLSHSSAHHSYLPAMREPESSCLQQPQAPALEGQLRSEMSISISATYCSYTLCSSSCLEPLLWKGDGAADTLIQTKKSGTDCGLGQKMQIGHKLKRVTHRKPKSCQGKRMS